ncbi:MAG TPA: amidohydrolase family protein, partial [Thermoanaerobaculia bacterium]
MSRTLERSAAAAAIVGPIAVLLLAAVLAMPARGGPSEVRSGDRLAFALAGARVITAPGRVFDPGVVVVRGGVIEAVGMDGRVAVPADARVFDLKGKTLHAAYIDPYVDADRLAGRRPRAPIDDEEQAEQPAPSGRGAAAGATPVPPPASPAHPEQRVLDSLKISDRVADMYRRLGFAVVAAVPSAGVLRGTGALLSLGDGPLETRVLDRDAGQYVSLEPERFDFTNFARITYPISKMGAVAMVRQAFSDAVWSREAEAAYSRRTTGQPRPRSDAASLALRAASEGKQAVVFEASDVLALLRAAKIAREWKLKARYVGAGDEYRLRAEVAAIKPDLILRVDFPRPLPVEDETEWLDVSLERLRRFDRSPSNPRWLRDAGLTFSLTTAGLEDPEDFGKRVREAMARGLSSDDALASMTTVPARQLGFADRLGSIDPGKIADLAVETGDPFAETSRVVEIWIDGRRHELPERRRAPEAGTRAAERSSPPARGGRARGEGEGPPGEGVGKPGSD